MAHEWNDDLEQDRNEAAASEHLIGANIGPEKSGARVAQTTGHPASPCVRGTDVVKIVRPERDRRADA